MNQVAAIVINRNTADLLADCLQSISEQDYEGGISTWVVDNGSTDGSPQMVLGSFDDVNLIWNVDNVGYARACNQGIDKTVEPYVIVMNSDTVLAVDTVRQLADFLDGNRDVAIVGPLLRNTDGSIQYSCREFPSIRDAFVHAFLGLYRPDNPSSSRYKKTAWDHAKEADVDWVSGAFMAIRREALEEAGVFDEGYFMYVEDVDLCWRMWQSGWKVCFIPRGDVYHHIGMSSRFASTRMLFHHHLSMLRFHLKTYRGPWRLPVNALVALGVLSRFTLIVVMNLAHRIWSRFGGKERLIMPGRQ